ncbi:hypothetical protein P3X46_015538 [Hevea brasiliensis]|uniref:Cathepsin propeptide inhibitor domain-containing protein n=1 Tax=Hevea brasiliensis TaxID=3981 RepID=A0ABQ9LWB4_HEVBR|nr:uncharacterized protein LOC110653347 isoform X1 [Hevea brasiliensis]KAJ9172282.1 hypothetical protein P3X46_015538 [Hevea brasiliensis]
MDEEEFRRLLDLFPVVRPRDYHIDLDPSRQSTTRPTQDDDVKKWQDAWEEQEGDQKETSNQTIDLHDAFWEKLKLAAEKKMGAAEAKKFCNAFQQVHRRLVYEELSLDAARSIINSTRSSGEQLSS